MTDASTIVANIDHGPGQVAGTPASPRRTVGKAKEAEQTNGRTFADSMKDADTRRSDVADKPAKTLKGLKNKAAIAVGIGKTTIKRSGTFGLFESRASALKSGRKKSIPLIMDTGNRRQNMLPTDDTGIRDDAEAAAVHEAAEAETRDVHAMVSGTILLNAKTLTGDDGSTGRKADSGNVKSTAAKRNIARIPVEDKLENTDLSSRSGKVEVVDNREFGRVEGKITSSFDKPAKAAASRPRGEAPARIDAGTNPVPRNEGFTVAESEIELSPAGNRADASRNAAAELSKKLDAEAGSDIVRQVKVVLNRANSGEVRINLRPDNLGRVRVRIQLEDNRLTGRIFVESAAAREAFRDAIEGLQTKLVEAGFGAADLELAWDDSAQNFADGQNPKGNSKAETGQSAREFDNTIPLAAADDTADGRVNLVV